MYSGSDSADSQKYSQWALNPSSFKNMANDQVDWAALAQQWIIMKEAGPPPIPGEHNVNLSSNSPPNANSTNKSLKNEGGEVPMEVENEKEESSRPWNNSVEPPPPPGAEPWAWNSQNQSWNWNNTWTGPGPAPHAPGAPQIRPPLLPTPNNVAHKQDEAFGGFGSAPPIGDYNSGYWTTSGVQQKQIKPHNKRYSKVNVPIKALVTPPAAVPITTEVQAAPVLDVNKRKQLPAWIREGLEKMEKEKLKQMEKEKEKQARDEYTEKLKQSEKEKMEILKTTMKEQQQKKSRFVSDDEDEKSEDDAESVIKKRSASPVALTSEELIVKVRKTMTEILLTVTNRFIEQICKEECQRYLKKVKASDQLASAPSGAIISAKLGLGAYNDDSSSSEDEEHDEKQSVDSETELKDTIRKKMQNFMKTEREIEDKLAEAEGSKAISRSRSSSPRSENDTQVDAHNQARKSPIEEKSSPKLRQRSPSSSSESSNYLTSKSRSRHRHSSNSSESDSKSRHKNRSRSDSRTPDKKHKSNRYSKSPSSKYSRSSRRDSNESKRRLSRRSRSYSRSRRSRSSSYKDSKRYSRHSRSRDRSSSRGRYSRSSRRSRSRSEVRPSRKHRSYRSRSGSSSRGKRSHRH